MKHRSLSIGHLVLLGVLGLGLAQPSLAARVSVTQPAKPGAKEGHWHGGSNAAGNPGRKKQHQRYATRQTGSKAGPLDRTLTLNYRSGLEQTASSLRPNRF
ncbi:MAG: hypothetical protein ABTR27_00585 [Candidatus Competibacter phosphatis]